MTWIGEWKGLLAALAVGLLAPGVGAARVEERPMSYEEAFELARAYMDEEDVARRERILEKVEAWSERLDEIARALRHRGWLCRNRGGSQ